MLSSVVSFCYYIGDQEAPQNEYFTRLLMGEGGGGGGGGDYRNNYMPGGRGGDGGGLVYLQVDQLTMSRDSTIVANGINKFGQIPRYKFHIQMPKW